MATNLRRARQAKKLTQEDLAHKAGLSARYIGSLERGAVSASVTVLGKLAKGLGVEAAELLRARKATR